MRRLKDGVAASFGRLLTAPSFWESDGWPARLLAPIGGIVGAVAAGRLRRAPETHAPMPVIAVGNFTVGGAGKTPTTAALVRLARRAGFAPAVMTRGYGGRLAGPLRVDPTRHTAVDIGDEPLLHAAAAPTIVARDRATGLALLPDAGADLVILDDGFQNPALAKDLAIVVVDRGQGVGNGRVMPAGPLRAPLAAQLDLASVLVVIDSAEADAPSLAALLAEARRRGIPVVTARLMPLAPERLAGVRVLAWAGIGRPSKFAATLIAAGAEVVDLYAFADHQMPPDVEAERLLGRAVAEDLALVTTEKDAVRLAGAASPTLRRLAAASRVVPVELRFDDETVVTALLGGLARR